MERFTWTNIFFYDTRVINKNGIPYCIGAMVYDNSTGKRIFLDKFNLERFVKTARREYMLQYSVWRYFQNRLYTMVYYESKPETADKDLENYISSNYKAICVIRDRVKSNYDKLINLMVSNTDFSEIFD